MRLMHEIRARKGHAKMKSFYENAATAALGLAMMLMDGCGGGTEKKKLWRFGFV